MQGQRPGRNPTYDLDAPGPRPGSMSWIPRAEEITTPENYPLSLNALRNACNQSSSREPVMSLDEDEVRQGLHVLEDMGLADSSQDGRVPKYEHRVRDQRRAGRA